MVGDAGAAGRSGGADGAGRGGGDRYTGRSSQGPSPARLARLPGDRGHRRKHLPLPLLPRRRNVRLPAQPFVPYIFLSINFL